VPELPVADVEAHNGITEMHSALRLDGFTRHRNWSRVTR
jgi:hypothetical protein